jgi:hypothetical protein
MDFFANLITPAVVAAAVAGIVSIYNNRFNNAAVQHQKLRERAWADYEIRRDAYIDIARLIDSLFEKGDLKLRPEFHRAARRVRLVGSDSVVQALNDLTRAIKSSDGNAEQKYSALFNEMRRDIRKLHELPPEGTQLAESAFPIES